MNASPPSLLCRYHYDPLDRLTSHVQSDTPQHHRFYCKSRLSTEIEGTIGTSIVQHDDLLLAQQQRESGSLDTSLLATDLQRSVLHTHRKNAEPQPFAYSPYGHRNAENGFTSLLGFNGERPEPLTGHYLLGNGYRAFNPVLMRFNSPDSWSPFGKGGLNAYAYCKGEPILHADSTGHMGSFVNIGNFFGSLFGRLENIARNYAIKKESRKIYKLIRGDLRQAAFDKDVLTHKLQTSTLAASISYGEDPARKINLQKMVILQVPSIKNLPDLPQGIKNSGILNNIDYETHRRLLPLYEHAEKNGYHITNRKMSGMLHGFEPPPPGATLNDIETLRTEMAFSDHPDLAKLNEKIRAFEAVQQNIVYKFHGKLFR